MSHRAPEQTDELYVKKALSLGTIFQPLEISSSFRQGWADDFAASRNSK